jgi:hypothetical protein
LIDPTLFASVASGGVFYSADGGRAWRSSGLEERIASDLVWFGPYVYAVTDAGLFRSEDAGRTWAPLGEGLQGQRLRRLVFPTAPQSGAEALVTPRRLFRSFDGVPLAMHGCGGPGNVPSAADAARTDDRCEAARSQYEPWELRERFWTGRRVTRALGLLRTQRLQPFPL